ncbi:hypothetical protein TCAL_15807 [Tigriopus californicus]|uniref:Uncharacterized protein n=1 Tax=Tigriopus californicus TaxID=6832 RepID=A0A553NPN4_TIGCA|nr:hypothetical protein TCAL_15807 [Tigriopus californicus]
MVSGGMAAPAWSSTGRLGTTSPTPSSDSSTSGDSDGMVTPPWVGGCPEREAAPCALECQLLGGDDHPLWLRPHSLDLDDFTRFLRAARSPGGLNADLDLAQHYPRVAHWFQGLRSASEAQATAVLEHLVKLLGQAPGPEAALDATWAAVMAATCVDVDPPQHSPDVTPFPAGWTFIPRSNRWDFDRILLYAFRRLAKVPGFQPDLELKPGLSCLSWLQSLVRHLLVQHDPLPQTADLAEFFGVLTRIHPQALEPNSGALGAWFIYNNEGLDAHGLIRDILNAARQTRQVPKFVSKLIIAMLEHRAILKFPASQPLVLDELNAVIPKLPFGQILDIGRTFNYHYEHDMPALAAPEEPVHQALDDLMASFFKHIPVLDHQVPRPVLDKVVKMVHHTAKVMADFSLRCDHGLYRTPLAVVSLAVHLAHYREIPFPSLITAQNAEYVESRFSHQYPFLAQQMYSLVPGTKPRMGPKSWPFPATCSNVLRPLVRGNFRLLLDFEDPNHPELLKAISKSFGFLAQSLFADVSNPNLDYHYFKVPLTVMKELDLRNLHPTMKSLAFIVNYLLAATSCYHEATISTIVNLRLICDVFTTPFDGFNQADGFALLWECSKFKMLGLELETPIWDNFARIVKLYISRIHLYAVKFPGTLGLIKKCWASVHSEGDYRQHRVFAIFMDEIAKPILHGDATHPEKVGICRDLFEEGKDKLFELLKVALKERQNTLLLQIASTLLGVHAKLNDTSIHRQDKSKILNIILRWSLADQQTPMPTRLLTTLFKNLTFYRDIFPSQLDKNVFRKLALMQVNVWSEGFCVCKKEAFPHFAEIAQCYFENVPAEDCILKDLTSNASCCYTMKFWRCFLRARKSKGVTDLGRPILEDHLLNLYKKALAWSPQREVIQHLVFLYEDISKADEPMVGSHLEANFLHLVGNSHYTEKFSSYWLEINQVLSNFVQRRYFRVVQPRIPMFMVAIDNLIKGVRIQNGREDKSLGDAETNTAYRACELDRTLSLLRNHKDDLTRVVVHLMPSLLNTLSQVISHVPTKKALNLAIYHVLDLCDEHSVNFLMGNLGPDLIELGRQVVQDHKTFHRYKGTV